MKGRVIKHRYVLFALIITGLFGAVLITQRSVRPAQAQEGTFITPSIAVIPAGQAYRQTNFVSDLPGFAAIQDPLLVNPWGITATSSSPLWIVNNGKSTATLYRGDVGGAPLVKNSSVAVGLGV